VGFQFKKLKKAIKGLHGHKEIKKKKKFKNVNLEIRICSLSQNIYAMRAKINEEKKKWQVN
jgi:hypothetical protein